jgi:hypothetical protein
MQTNFNKLPSIKFKENLFSISPVPKCRHTDGLTATVKITGALSNLLILIS